MRTLIVSALAVVAVGAAPIAAEADVVARWQMDEAAGASTMVDSAPAGGENDGTITAVETGDSGLVSGRAYTFNGMSSMVRVPDSLAFDPGSKAMTITATVRASSEPMADDSYDLVRKGVTTTRGGDWKMEIKNIKRLGTVGKLKCTFRGSVEVVKTASPDIMDGANHKLECIKNATSVTAKVDGRSFTKSVAAGSIANDVNTMLGAKIPGDDVYNGYLDEVSVDIATTP